MSYEISYRRKAIRLTPIQSGAADDVFFLLEEIGSNNCTEMDSRRRARSWQCSAAGRDYECLAEITRCAAACCSGSLIIRRPTTPEQYIRSWRRAMAEAMTLSDAAQAGFYLHLFTRISAEESTGTHKHTYEQLRDQTLVAQYDYTAPYSDRQAMGWRFDVDTPEQVALWLQTRRSGRSWQGVEVDGP